MQCSLILLLLFSFCLFPVQSAQFRIAQLFAPSAVLQHGEPINIWGWAQPSSLITAAFSNAYLNVSFSGNTTADVDGLWVVTFPPQPVADDWVIFATTGEVVDPRCRYNVFYCTTDALYVRYVHTGDVICCLGQSNMQVNVYFAFNSTAEIDNSYEFTQSISYMQVEAAVTAPIAPLGDFAVAPNIPWTLASPATVGLFSATCWFAAKSLIEARKSAGPRLGLIAAPWGGTSIKVHAPVSVNTSCALLFPGSAQGCGGTAPCAVSCLYNSMLAPIHGPRGFPVAAMIWSQGENDVGYDSWYSCMLQGLAASLRTLFASPRAHWVTMQLAPYDGGASLAPFRAMQCATTATIPNASCIVLADDGDIYSPIGSVHSRNKQLAGLRIGAVLASALYGVPLPTRGGVGPTFQSVDVAVGPKGELTAAVTFDAMTLGPLGLISTPPSTSPWSNATRCATDNGVIKLADCGWFTILASNGIAYNATALLLNKTSLTLTAAAPESTIPVGVSWGWGAWPVNEFANEYGYPLVPFYYNASAAAVVASSSQPSLRSTL